MQPQPLIAVNNVEASSRWYQKALGLQSGHGGNEYEMLLHDGHLVLQLHNWEAHNHPQMGDPKSLPYGNGTLLWFWTDEFDDAVDRAVGAGANVVEGPKENVNAQHREIWLRDPDGYTVVLAGPYGDVGM